MRRVLTIDPGIRTCGYAYWYNLSDTKLPDCSGIWRQKTGTDWKIAVRGQWLEFKLFIQKPIDLVVIETPSVWGSAKSHASAVKGDLFKMAHMIGGFHYMCAMWEIDIELITPRDWKGQLPKRVVEARLIKQYGQKFRDHECDAVGIGSWIYRRMLNENAEG